ncbi:uncharacterized protein SOCE26_050990 [Sorangium cellulosum]|uniref:Uncharacterized protein n=1 Tax=Sorangium cellulosum TaxID=56 RepID=A0A2L0EWH1_SORCE|nr:hypothetical protein [Sorangium cellulosum]AUX43647.1 uncharacterized protein SOCE26_050990 [Sorangium cellulosum]
MSHLPDAGTLDALVLGLSEAADEHAWEGLVIQPGGAEAWRAAVARRRRLDAIAGAVRGRAWLARAMRQVTALSRRARTPLDVELSLDFPDAQFQTLVDPMLGPSDEREPAEVVRPAWGRIVPVHMPRGERVTLRAAEGQAAIDVRYLCRDQDGSLPERTWMLEADEAPVLLLALIGAPTGTTLREAVEQATAIAAVLVLEAPANGETPA